MVRPKIRPHIERETSVNSFLSSVNSLTELLPGLHDLLSQLKAQSSIKLKTPLLCSCCSTHAVRALGRVHARGGGHAGGSGRNHAQCRHRGRDGELVSA